MKLSLLSLKNVSYRYEMEERDVLQSISAEFDLKKMYVIMGKSGEGKTTLLSLLAGLDNASEGSITYKGEDLQKLNRDTYRAENIGMIFQGYHLLMNATALDNVVLSMEISKNKSVDKKKDAVSLLEKVGISEETAKRKALKLSGGEQQRVAIARALAHAPDIILADEPTGNLDEETGKNIMEIFECLAHQEGKCVIIVTHSKEVSRYADELLELHQGKLLLRKS